jgi:hypothetical protein
LGVPVGIRSTIPATWDRDGRTEAGNGTALAVSEPSGAILLRGSFCQVPASILGGSIERLTQREETQ